MKNNNLNENDDLWFISLGDLEKNLNMFKCHNVYLQESSVEKFSTKHYELKEDEYSKLIEIEIPNKDYDLVNCNKAEDRIVIEVEKKKIILNFEVKKKSEEELQKYKENYPDGMVKTYYIEIYINSKNIKLNKSRYEYFYEAINEVIEKI